MTPRSGCGWISPTALFLSGQLAAADDVAAETETHASAAGDEVGELRARLLSARIAAHMPGEGTDSEGPSATLLAVAEECAAGLRARRGRARTRRGLVRDRVGPADPLPLGGDARGRRARARARAPRGLCTLGRRASGLAGHRHVLRPDSRRRGPTLVRGAAGPASDRPHAAGDARGDARKLRPSACAGWARRSGRQRSSARSSGSPPAAWPCGRSRPSQATRPRPSVRSGGAASCWRSSARSGTASWP